MFTDSRYLYIEQLSQVLLGQPELLIVKQYTDFLVTVRGAVKDDFVVLLHTSPPEMRFASSSTIRSRVVSEVLIISTTPC